MSRVCITIACKVIQEREVEPGLSKLAEVERCFSFYILYYGKFYSHSDIDHWVDFAQGYLKENYGAKNLRMTSISELRDIFSARGADYIKVLDFEYLLKSYDVD